MKKGETIIKFLGTGANGGVPQIDCRCKNCKSNLNIRKRSSILIEANNKKLIIDCGPDFHTQLVDNYLRLQDISAILISHLHWDHCIGLVELTSGKKLKVPIITHKTLQKNLLKNGLFSFIFENGFAKFQAKVSKIKIHFIPIRHAPRFKTFAIKLIINTKIIIIATDILYINNALIKEITNADLVIFDATFLEETKHWHISIKESTPILKTLNNNVIFTHVNHSEKPREIIKFLKTFNFKLAFDEMRIKL